jgi:hypothetical protein
MKIQIISIFIIDFFNSHCYNVYNLIANVLPGGSNEENGIVNSGG